MNAKLEKTQEEINAKLEEIEEKITGLSVGIKEVRVELEKFLLNN